MKETVDCSENSEAICNINEEKEIKVEYTNHDMKEIADIDSKIINSEQVTFKTNHANLNENISENTDFRKTFTLYNKLEEVLPIEFSKDSLDINVAKEVIGEYKHSEADLNTVACNSLEQNETMSFINEFDEVLKEFKENIVDSIKVSNPSLPVLTLSETEDFLNSMRYANETIEISVKPGSTTNKQSDNISTDIPELHNYAATTIFEETMSNEFTKTARSEFSTSLNDSVIDIELLTTEAINNYHFTYEFIEETDVIKGNEKDVSIDSRNSKEIIVINEIKKSAELKDIETISISSTENDSIVNENKVDDSDCEGYNSSDFEFISEHEACFNGFIPSFNSKGYHIKNTKTPNVVYEENSLEFFDQCNKPVPNARNTLVLEKNNDVQHILEQQRNVHRIPEGDAFLEMFAQPWSFYQFEAESKAFYSTKAMNIEADNIGFDIGLLNQLHKEDKVDSASQQEADETVKKILSLYPKQNTV